MLSIEWMKLKKYRTFWVLVGCFALLLPFWNYGINSGTLRSGGDKNINIFNQAYSFGQVWQNMGWWSSLFVVFISVLIIIIATNEYSFRTSRQNIIDGQTRLHFLHSKWLLVLILSILTTLYVFINGLLFGIANDSLENFPGKIINLFYTFVLTLNYYGFGLLLGLLLKRSGIAIGLFFLYNMFLEKLIQSLINWKIDLDIGNLLPLQASDELLPFPLTSFAKEIMKSEVQITNETYVIVSFVWIIIYYIISRARLLKTDW